MSDQTLSKGDAKALQVSLLADIEEMCGGCAASHQSASLLLEHASGEQLTGILTNCIEQMDRGMELMRGYLAEHGKSESGVCNGLKPIAEEWSTAETGGLSSGPVLDRVVASRMLRQSHYAKAGLTHYAAATKLLGQDERSQHFGFAVDGIQQAIDALEQVVCKDTASGNAA